MSPPDCLRLVLPVNQMLMEVHQRIRENMVMNCDKLQFNPMATILSKRCKLHHN